MPNVQDVIRAVDACKGALEMVVESQVALELDVLEIERVRDRINDAVDQGFLVAVERFDGQSGYRLTARGQHFLQAVNDAERYPDYARATLSGGPLDGLRAVVEPSAGQYVLSYFDPATDADESIGTFEGISESTVSECVYHLSAYATDDEPAIFTFVSTPDR